MSKHTSVQLNPDHLSWLRKRKWQPGIDIRVSIAQTIELYRVVEDETAMQTLFGSNAKKIQAALLNATKDSSDVQHSEDL